ncbi:hypothetical protein DXG03_006125 [Asterophora parasitica]|uniref:Uncharacterized protein n=1 Tax=Asterophora parasitica TaxID=117018 RepID=A0A9P7GF48_9AGAR|nr:hypothetical protein DXG03_006125 [Asterophora parasitica]
MHGPRVCAKRRYPRERQIQVRGPFLISQPRGAFLRASVRHRPASDAGRSVSPDSDEGALSASESSNKGKGKGKATGKRAGTFLALQFTVQGSVETPGFVDGLILGGFFDFYVIPRLIPWRSFSGDAGVVGVLAQSPSRESPCRK